MLLYKGIVVPRLLRLALYQHNATSSKYDIPPLSDVNVAYFAVVRPVTT